jgi:N-acetylglucosaminyldiphosphoundecaprenol N-acetyl-beta-D-mannosaminyltransferase
MGAVSERAPVLGVDCFAGSLESAADAVVARALSGRGGFACLGNVHVLVTASGDPAVRSALEDAWVVFPDGFPVAWMQRRSGASASRIAGPDLMPAVFELGQAVRLRHFLFGSTDDVLAALETGLAICFPTAQIVGRLAPAQDHEDSSEALEFISCTCPQVVWVALGAPKQELWAARHAAALSPAVVVGVGAAFDFLAGSKRRAPAWMQRSGLEWLHRLATEPRRLGWRYVSTNSRFALSVLRGGG